MSAVANSCQWGRGRARGTRLVVEQCDVRISALGSICISLHLLIVIPSSGFGVVVSEEGRLSVYSKEPVLPARVGSCKIFWFLSWFSSAGKDASIESLPASRSYVSHMFYLPLPERSWPGMLANRVSSDGNVGEALPVHIP